ncbi:MAG: hypothetical protein ACKVRO_17925 [Micropepsaceae bacterium]
MSRLIQFADYLPGEPVIAAIKTIFYFGPLLFGIGFIAPLTAQILERAGWHLPFGATPLIAGLILGAVWGGYAQIRGRWL